VLHSEVTAGAAWASVSETPEVSMEASIAFTLCELTERVRHEERLARPGRRPGRQAHIPRTWASHLCLLKRKHEVEEAIYGIGLTA
jgi:hypothetical protein